MSIFVFSFMKNIFSIRWNFSISNLYCYIKAIVPLRFYTLTNQTWCRCLCFRTFVVFLLSLECKTVSVFELSQQLLEEVSPEAARDKRLQRQEASLQMSLLHIHIAVPFGYLQTRETSARESGRFRHRYIAHEQLLFQG